MGHWIRRAVSARNLVSVDLGDEASDERDFAENYTFAFAMTGTKADPRRMVVGDVSCANCHGEGKTFAVEKVHAR